MDPRRWFGPLASAAALTLMGSLAAFAVEGVAAQRPADVAVEHAPLEANAPDDGGDLVLQVELDTSSDDVVEGEGDGRPEDAPDNHGQTVSDFARSTDLEGCEKGHAISAVARGADPEDPQGSDLYRPCNTGGPDAADEGDVGAGGSGHVASRGQGNGQARGVGHAMRGGNGRGGGNGG